MHKITIVDGVEGWGIYLNDFRIAGSKPWGGGKVLFERQVKDEDMEDALKQAGEEHCICGEINSRNCPVHQ